MHLSVLCACMLNNKSAVWDWVNEGCIKKDLSGQLEQNSAVKVLEATVAWYSTCSLCGY